MIGEYAINTRKVFKGIEETVHSPFRVVPFFDPAPWAVNG